MFVSVTFRFLFIYAINSFHNAFWLLVLVSVGSSVGPSVRWFMIPFSQMPQNFGRHRKHLYLVYISIISFKGMIL